METASRELMRLGMPSSLIDDLVMHQVQLFEGAGVETVSAKLKEQIDALQKGINSQVLYLPTYRRIERELESIFEGMDQSDFKRKLRRIRHEAGDEACVELVEFGMNDVERAVNQALGKFKDFAVKSLNDLTLRHFGDVVMRDYESVKPGQISAVSDDMILTVLDRIHDDILSPERKQQLYHVLTSARTRAKPSDHDAIIYHYFFKLLDFQESLQNREKSMNAFCNLCSEYIKDKLFVYDSSDFAFRITPRHEHGAGESVELKDLSSGEKQIVSLFSHLYLSGKRRFLVLIDEPELSLSVPWQRRFLCDIRSGEYCSGLIAVTHSPFIYDNELQSAAHALGEFIV